ncbi:unnamed protein product, partial [marine sediment metagenome]
MSITLNRKNGSIIVENRVYIIALNPNRGGVIRYLRNKKAKRSLIYREGCEIWSPRWGSFRSNHYQQERGGSAKFEVKEEASIIKVKVESKMG